MVIKKNTMTFAPWAWEAESFGAEVSCMNCGSTDITIFDFCNSDNCGNISQSDGSRGSCMACGNSDVTIGYECNSCGGEWNAESFGAEDKRKCEVCGSQVHDCADYSCDDNLCEACCIKYNAESFDAEERVNDKENSNQRELVAFYQDLDDVVYDTQFEGDYEDTLYYKLFEGPHDEGGRGVLYIKEHFENVKKLAPTLYNKVISKYNKNQISKALNDLDIKNNFCESCGGDIDLDEEYNYYGYFVTGSQSPNPLDRAAMRPNDALGDIQLVYYGYCCEHCEEDYLDVISSVNELDWLVGEEVTYSIIPEEDVEKSDKWQESFASESFEAEGYTHFQLFLANVFSITRRDSVNIQASKGLKQAISDGTFLNYIEESEFTVLMEFAEAEEYEKLVNYLKELYDKSIVERRREYDFRRGKKKKKNAESFSADIEWSFCMYCHEDYDESEEHHCPESKGWNCITCGGNLFEIPDYLWTFCMNCHGRFHNEHDEAILMDTESLCPSCAESLGAESFSAESLEGKKCHEYFGHRGCEGTLWETSLTEVGCDTCDLEHLIRPYGDGKDAEELKRDSCCCGATKSHPCACMIQGVMKCDATCPCSLAKKGAESFEAEDNGCVKCGAKVINIWREGGVDMPLCKECYIMHFYADEYDIDVRDIWSPEKEIIEQIKYDSNLKDKFPLIDKDSYWDPSKINEWTPERQTIEEIRSNREYREMFPMLGGHPGYYDDSGYWVEHHDEYREDYSIPKLPLWGQILVLCGATIGIGYLAKKLDNN